MSAPSVLQTAPPDADAASTHSESLEPQLVVDIGPTTRGSTPPPKPAFALAPQREHLQGTRLGVPPNEMLDPSLATIDDGEERVERPPKPGASAEFKQTMLGVAQPGIAPLEASQRAEASPANHAAGGSKEPKTSKSKSNDGDAQPHDWIVESTRNPGPPVEMGTDRDDEAQLAKRERPGKRQAWWLIGSATGLLAGLGAFAAFWSAPTPLSGAIEAHEHQTRLTVSCPDCPSGTRLRLVGSDYRTLSNGQVGFELDTPPRVGINRFTLDVERPGFRRDETLALEVPVHFKAYGDSSQLASPKPELALVVEAMPNTGVIVEGSPLVLDANGMGRFALDLSEQSQGEARDSEVFEQIVHYTVKPATGDVERGELTLKAKFAPLQIVAPGPSVVTDREHFMLAGRTAAGGTVTVADKPITVDPKGHFAQWMSVDSEGETEIQVRASAEGLAPRVARVKVKRVGDLREEANRFRQMATSDFERFAAKPDAHRGLPVALEGVIEDVRSGAQTTVFLLDVKRGCAAPPCLARVVYGQKANLSRGSEVSVFGLISGATETEIGKVRLPELHAEFLLQK